jgi:hypothetical protein
MKMGDMGDLKWACHLTNNMELSKPCHHSSCLLLTQNSINRAGLILSNNLPDHVTAQPSPLAPCPPPLKIPETPNLAVHCIINNCQEWFVSNASLCEHLVKVHNFNPDYTTKTNFVELMVGRGSEARVAGGYRPTAHHQEFHTVTIKGGKYYECEHEGCGVVRDCKKDIRAHNIEMHR